MNLPTNAAPAAGSAPAEATPAPVAPASTPAPAAAASTPAKPDVKSLMASLTPEQRQLVATGRANQVKLTPEQVGAAKPAPPAAPASAPAAAPQEPVAATPAAAETPAAGPAEVPAAAPVEPTAAAPAAAPANPEGASPEVQPEAGEGKDGGRVRLHGDDYAIAVLAKSKGISLLEAAKIYAGTTPAQPPAAAEPTTPAAPAADPRVTEYDTRISEAQTRLQSLQSDYKTAAENMDSDKMAELVVKIGEAQTDARLLANEKAGYINNQKQSVQSAHQTKVDASRDRAVSEFPVLANENGMERLALDAYIDRAYADPARKAEFRDPNWPEKITREFCAKNGIQPKTAQAAPTAPAAAPAKPAPFTRPAPTQVAPTTAPVGAKILTGADGRTPSASSTMTRDSVLETVRTDPEARRAIVRNLSKLSPPGGRR